MKDLGFVALLFLVFLSVSAQRPDRAVFTNPYPNDGLYFADGVFQFFAESDRQLRQGDIERSILTLDNAIAQYPLFAESYLKRSKLLARFGRSNEARKDFETAYRLNPYLAKFRSNGSNLGRLDLLAFDLAWHRQFLEDLPSASVRNLLQESLDKKLAGDLNGALQNADKLLLQLDQPIAQLHAFRGNLHLLLENYEEAVADYSRAIQISPGEGEWYFNRGVARLFTYYRAAACADLETSNELGFERSKDKLKFFCFN